MACRTPGVPENPAYTLSAPADNELQGMPSPSEMISDTLDVTDQLSPGDLNPTKSIACPKLNSPLDQLVASSDPISTAKQLNLAVMDGKVQVLLILVDEDASFLKEYSIEIGSQQQNQVQVYVRIDQLCDLAASEHVILVQVPAQATLP